MYDGFERNEVRRKRGYAGGVMGYGWDRRGLGSRKVGGGVKKTKKV